MTLAIDVQLSEKNWRRKVSSWLAGLPSGWKTGSKTYDPPSLADGAQTSTTVTVTGAVFGQVAMAAFSLDTQGIVLSAVVSSANTVRVTLRNNTGGSIDLGSGTLTAAVLVP